MPGVLCASSLSANRANITRVTWRSSIDYSSTPSSDLALDLRADTEVSVDGSDRVYSWADQHLALNNDASGPHNATQDTEGNRPYLTNDGTSAVIVFPWAYTHPQNFLTVPDSLSGMSTRSISVYIVGTLHSQGYNKTALALKGHASGWLKTTASGGAPQALYVSSRPSTIYPPINKCVFVAVGRSSDSVAGYNSILSELASAGESTGLSGAEIGRYHDGSQYMDGLIYRVLIYKAAHTNEEIAAVVNALASQHSVQTTYTDLLVCRGDSLTAGVGSSMLLTWPEQYRRLKGGSCPLIYNMGEGSRLISQADTLDAAFIDPLFDADKTSRLAVLLGTNDINSDGLTGAQGYARLIDYCADRKSAEGWPIDVLTLPDRASVDVAIADYNDLIRDGDESYDAVIDIGKNSPSESRLNDSTNTTYYDDDQLHLTNAGYGVIAENVNG